jgi:hypothetical protein
VLTRGRSLAETTGECRSEWISEWGAEDGGQRGHAGGGAGGRGGAPRVGATHFQKPKESKRVLKLKLIKDDNIH